ncbi:metallophosphoesterase family protein [Candidatus Arthromitus sp. SFB-rat-Yit]|uniref:metallophosphoesterase family protein n=1 Tax=Candidatus Arthromitus sp. SFB-rat-Yit TaxID=1041504 RepID=UPI001FA79D8E|nr:metallophosphoesterase family protein [Candidatus Arthromitus sp. SFB-rat-Yit]
MNLLKIGIISNIHSNLYSLMEIYNLLEKECVEIILCLGDIVGYGPHPNEVVNFIRRKHIVPIKGIYDSAVINNDFSHINENTINNFSVDFTRTELTKNNLYYLSNLPLELSMNFGELNIKFVHKNPYINNQDIQEDILVCGYEHIPDNIKLSKEKCIIMPGSCGKPVPSIGGVSCGVLEVSNNFYNYNILKCEHFFSKINKDMKMMNFPEILINSYEIYA